MILALARPDPRKNLATLVRAERLGVPPRLREGRGEVLVVAGLDELEQVMRDRAAETVAARSSL